MSNMSYCRFENTYHDLRDCFRHWNQPENDDEKSYKKELLKLCKEIVEENR